MELFQCAWKGSTRIIVLLENGSASSGLQVTPSKSKSDSFSFGVEQHIEDF